MIDYNSFIDWWIITITRKTSWNEKPNHYNIMITWLTFWMNVKKVNIKLQKQKKTTFNNGYLGSRNDDERSEMRYVMWIAGFRESSKSWTQLALIRECQYVYLSIDINHLTLIFFLKEVEIRNERYTLVIMRNMMYASWWWWRVYFLKFHGEGDWK